MHGVQGVEGSNALAPTMKIKGLANVLTLFIFAGRPCGGPFA